MKALFVIILLMSIVSANTQNTNNIWEITGNFLVEEKEISPDTDFYPEYHAGIVAYSFEIFKDQQFIIDADYEIPTNNDLLIYRFRGQTIHSRTFLMIVKNGRWKIINMKEPLIGIMKQSIEICELLNLDSNDSLLAIQEILRIYKYNLDKIKGSSVPIIHEK